jgi:hypothetical protein
MAQGGLDERGVLAFFASRLAPTGDWVHTVKTVGASLLAMDVNDDAGCLDECSVWAFFASKPAPTRKLGSHGQNCRSQLAGDGR